MYIRIVCSVSSTHTVRVNNTNNQPIVALAVSLKNLPQKCLSEIAPTCRTRGYKQQQEEQI